MANGKRLKVYAEKRKLDGNNPTGALHDWVITCSNGELPQEGYGHRTKADAMTAIKALYSSPVWDYRRGSIAI